MVQQNIKNIINKVYPLIAKEFHLFDKWMDKLIKKNGKTNY